MTSRVHIASFVGLTIAAWVLALWIGGHPVLSWDFLRPFGTVVTIVVGVAFVFNQWAWAWSLFSGWYVKRPDLRGTWQIRILSDWKDPQTGKLEEPKICYLTIRQSLSELSARLVTEESKSKSIAYSLLQEEEGIFQLAVSYRNEPKIELQGSRSEIHHGSFLIEVTKDSEGYELSGHYWTDRKTRGEMASIGRVSRAYDSFQRAADAFGEKNE